jgi:hypothetical protein
MGSLQLLGSACCHRLTVLTRRLLQALSTAEFYSFVPGRRLQPRLQPRSPPHLQQLSGAAPHTSSALPRQSTALPMITTTAAFTFSFQERLPTAAHCRHALPIPAPCSRAARATFYTEYTAPAYSGDDYYNSSQEQPPTAALYRHTLQPLSTVASASSPPRATDAR